MVKGITVMKKIINSALILKIALLLFLIIHLAGCSLLRSGIASLKSTADFRPLEADDRILAEPGAENLAKQVSGYLPQAIITVQTEQYRDFIKPVRVYVCASEDSFVSHTGASKNVSGVVTTKLFFSRKLSEFPPEQIQSRVIHELSHLHLQQQLGTYHFDANIPAWFQEGLAVLVSAGGGAERVSEAEAVKAILAGKHFAPEAQGSFFFKKTGKSYSLEPHMFYRQASLFVGYMKNLSPLHFGLFMLSIEDRGDFDRSFHTVYGMGIDEAWQDFVILLKNKQREMHFACYGSLSGLSRGRENLQR